MPYQWTKHSKDTSELHLWPHQSLPARGMAAFVLATFGLITLPLFGLLGTMVLWGLFPFLLLAVGGIWFALSRSHSDRSILEVLLVDRDEVSLVRRGPRQSEQSWSCNAYWVRPALHETGGPVPNYVTLRGNGREVEVGAFLSEEERLTLYGDLVSRLAR